MQKNVQQNPEKNRPTVPEGLRIYAIGDIHGRIDLLDALLAKIDRDASTTKKRAIRVFLGDYIDRGAQSRQVLDRLIGLQQKDAEANIFLIGNHELVMRELLEKGDPFLLQDWLRFGGRETLLSYGIELSQFTKAPETLLPALAAACPPEHRQFLNSLKLSTEFGSYFFCHAGARPGVALNKQAEKDLIWIRNEFLNYTGSFGKIIVHGHTICEKVERHTNRINIDTGAYATGCLTALGLEGSRWCLLQTR